MNGTKVEMCNERNKDITTTTTTTMTKTPAVGEDQKNDYKIDSSTHYVLLLPKKNYNSVNNHWIQSHELCITNSQSQSVHQVKNYIFTLRIPSIFNVDNVILDIMQKYAHLENRCESRNRLTLDIEKSDFIYDLTQIQLKLNEYSYKMRCLLLDSNLALLVHNYNDIDSDNENSTTSSTTNSDSCNSSNLSSDDDSSNYKNNVKCVYKYHQL